MTLTIQTEEDEQRQLKVTVDVAEERVQRAMHKKARELARELHIPGFRRGKAPYGVIVRRVGAEALRVEAVDDLAQQVFEEMLAELDVITYGQPTLDDMDIDPLKMQFTIPLEPLVKLGDYRSIRMEQEPVEVTEEAVDDALEHIRAHHEVVEPVDRASELGDRLTLGGVGTFEDDEGIKQTLFDQERSEMLLDADVTFKGSAFVEQLVGLEAGDDKAFQVTFPEDYVDESVAGREVSFELTVLDVNRRTLPDLDDELAKLEGDYETLDELRASLKENLTEQAKQQARSDFFEGMVEKIRSDAQISYPPAAVEAELDEMMANMKQQTSRIGWEWDDFLRLQNQTEESLREDWRESAMSRFERDQVLLQFVREEKLVLQPEMIDTAIEEQIASMEDDELRNRMREYYKDGPGLQRLSNELVLEMIMERMEAVGAGTAPDLEALEQTEEAGDEEETELPVILDEDALEEDALEEDALEEDAPEEDALFVEQTAEPDAASVEDSEEAMSPSSEPELKLESASELVDIADASGAASETGSEEA